MVLQSLYLMKWGDTMNFFLILCGIAAAAAMTVLLISFICYRMAFYAKKQPAPIGDEIQIPEGEIYEVFRPEMETWTREMRAMSHEEFSIQSFDGLTLTGKYFEYAPGAPMEIMFHGYRGNAERDLPGGVQRCFQIGRSVLLVDQRCAGNSDGHTITFGIREHRDCLSWVDFACRHFGPDVKIILTGISMGASTVLMAGGCELPENVIGILADCGFSSARDIIRTIIPQMGIPADLGYPFVRLGAKLWGGFDLEETSPMEMVRKCRVPVIFFHGESDDFVPCDMSRKLYDACTSRKKLVTVPGAGHGLAYPVDQEGYLKALREFFGPEASFHQ